MTKQPSYRFADYDEPWEEKKLGEVAELLNGRAYKQEELLEDGEYRVLRVGNFNTNDRWYYSDLQLEDSKYANYGDLLYLWATNFGPELWKEEKVIYHYHIWKISGYSNILDKYYFYTFLEKDKNRIKQNTNGSTMVHITKGMMEERVLTFPSLPEQTVIGSFFQDIDQLISLQQRKLEVLKEQKKTYLKLLFPAKGQTKPALRFAGFEDEWKEVKLGEIAELKRGLTYKPTSVVENGIRVLRSSNIDGDVFKKQEDDVFVEDSSVTIPYVQFGDILITAANGSSKLVGKHAIIEDSEKMVHGGFMLLARSKQYKFLNALLSSEWYSRFINVSVAGGNGAIGNLSKSNLEKEIVLCPTIPEQEAIGSFFQDLDKAIAKQEEKVNQFKESKQTLLRKMFI